MNVLWEGPDPEDTTACPYPIDFESKPAPADTLNSLESGKVLLQVSLGGGVKSVSVRVENNSKRENLEKIQGSSDLKRTTMLFAKLVPDGREPGWWTGKLSIPSTWIEGGTITFERTGAASPKSERNIYTMEMTYELKSNVCTARFFAVDAFHWHARQKASM